MKTLAVSNVQQDADSTLHCLNVRKIKHDLSIKKRTELKNISRVSWKVQEYTVLLKSSHCRRISDTSNNVY